MGIAFKFSLIGYKKPKKQQQQQQKHLFLLKGWAMA